MKNYSVVVTAIKEEDAGLGKMKSHMQYYFENPVDAVEFYQQLKTEPDVVYINICATLDEEQA